MAEVKIQDVFRKLRARKELLTPAETKAPFAHLDSLAERIGELERMLAEARLEEVGVSQQSSTMQVREKKATVRQTSKPGKKEILEKYELLYEALKHARPTNYTDGEAHYLYLNQMAALAADAAALYELGVAIGSPLRLSEEDEEDESDRDAVAVWSEIIQNSLLTNETLVVLSANDQDEQATVRASMDAVVENMKTGRLGNVPLPQEVIEIEGIVPWSEKPAKALFHLLVESMGLGAIGKALSRAEEEHSDGAVFTAITGSKFLGDVLDILSTSYYSDDFEQLELMESYLGDGCSPGELRKLRLPRNLTIEDRFMLLAAILKCRIGLRSTQDLQEHARLWLWLDRLENILHYTPKELNEFRNGLATILNHSPMMLTLCWNISSTDHETPAKVLKVFGPDLVERVDYNLIERSGNKDG
jgi:hypothetical protein